MSTCNNITTALASPPCVARAAAERPGPGVPGQVPPAARGDPGVCSGQRQDQAPGRPGPPEQPVGVVHQREAQQGPAVRGGDGGRLHGARLRHTPLGTLRKDVVPYPRFGNKQKKRPASRSRTLDWLAMFLTTAHRMLKGPSPTSACANAPRLRSIG